MHEGCDDLIDLEVTTRDIVEKLQCVNKVLAYKFRLLLMFSPNHKIQRPDPTESLPTDTPLLAPADEQHGVRTTFRNSRWRRPNATCISDDVALVEGRCHMLTNIGIVFTPLHNSQPASKSSFPLCIRISVPISATEATHMLAENRLLSSSRGETLWGFGSAIKPVHLLPNA